MGNYYGLERSEGKFIPDGIHTDCEFRGSRTILLSLGGKEIISGKRYFVRQCDTPYVQTAAIVVDDLYCVYNTNLYTPHEEYTLRLRMPDLDNGTSFDGGYALHSIQMLAAMVRHRKLLSEEVVLDQGAGIGTLGIGAVLLGAHRSVLIEDMPELLHDAHAICSLNALSHHTIHCICDDILASYKYRQHIEHATVGVINIGHGYSNTYGWPLQENAFQTLLECPQLRTVFVGGYFHWNDVPSLHDAGKAWTSRDDNLLVHAENMLNSFGYQAKFYIDGWSDGKSAYSLIAQKIEQ